VRFNEARATVPVARHHLPSPAVHCLFAALPMAPAGVPMFRSDHQPHTDVTGAELSGMRRRVLRLGTAALASLAVPALHAAPAATKAPLTLPVMTDGPFYPPPRWRARRVDWDADLTVTSDSPGATRAQGEHLGLQLRLQDADGRVIDGAEVEIWQCDARAAYRHPNVDAGPGQFDPGFQGFGAARSARDGTLAFRTIRPVPYPGRTPHIHVKLRHASFGERTSQLFVDADPGNARDGLWRRLDDAEREALALQLHPARDAGLRWTAQHTLVLPA
jgi:protocatechuate 3,4-dioxygenase, beta subunit